MIKYIVKKSIDLSHKEKQQLCNIFEMIFYQKRTMNELEKQFVCNHKGYVYVALMLDEQNDVIGSMSVVPLRYRYFGEELTFGRGIDAMILKEHRGNLLNLKKMSDLLENILKEDGVSFIFSAPNEQNYTIRKRISKWSDIYNLDIYALPVNIGRIKPHLKSLTLFSKIYARTVNLLVLKKCYLSDEHFNIEKVLDDKYIENRYNSSYKTVICGENTQFVYKVKNFEGIETAFIVDVLPLNKSNIEYAVKYIVSLEKSVDLIVYFGFLKFSPINFYRLPERIKPKNTYVAGKILLPDVIDERIFGIENWNFNLSDLDWI